MTKYRVLITAGPTQEAIDPVRYISNRSSGKMGYALAEVIQKAGHEVVLVSGPTCLPVPEDVRCRFVKSAEQMLDAVMHEVETVDVFISVAAVSDYRPKELLAQKHKKSGDSWTLELVKNPDILATVAALDNKPFCVGFAAETENIVEHGREKLIRKNIDMIAVNDVAAGDIGFDHQYNSLFVLGADMEVRIDRALKVEVAQQLWGLIYEQSTN